METKRYIQQPISNARHIHQPGNGTRYDLLFGKYKYLDYYKSEITYFFVTWLNKSGVGGTTFSFPIDSQVHFSYFQEKTGLNEADSAAILGFLENQQVFVGSYPKGFNKLGQFKGKES